MALSYWLRAEVDDLLNEDTFFDSSDYSCLLEDTDWAQFLVLGFDNEDYIVLSTLQTKTIRSMLEKERLNVMQAMFR